MYVTYEFKKKLFCAEWEIHKIIQPMYVYLEIIHFYKSTTYTFLIINLMLLRKVSDMFSSLCRMNM